MTLFAGGSKKIIIVVQNIVRDTNGLKKLFYCHTQILDLIK
jgi:hypothetical protein